jgi:hypothetical protein
MSGKKLVTRYLSILPVSISRAFKAYTKWIRYVSICSDRIRTMCVLTSALHWVWASSFFCERYLNPMWGHTMSLLKAWPLCASSRKSLWNNESSAIQICTKLTWVSPPPCHWTEGGV